MVEKIAKFPITWEIVNGIPRIKRDKKTGMNELEDRKSKATPIVTHRSYINPSEAPMIENSKGCWGFNKSAVIAPITPVVIQKITLKGKMTPENPPISIVATISHEMAVVKPVRAPSRFPRIKPLKKIVYVIVSMLGRKMRMLDVATAKAENVVTNAVSEMSISLKQ